MNDQQVPAPGLGWGVGVTPIFKGHTLSWAEIITSFLRDLFPYVDFWKKDIRWFYQKKTMAWSFFGPFSTTQELYLKKVAQFY